MKLNYLEHFLIYAKNIEATKKFYVDVLGLKAGVRPAFKFKGYWLYLNDIPVVHLVDADINDKEKAAYLPKHTYISKETGAIDHIAFNASHYHETVAHLNNLGIEMQQRIVPEEGNAHQIFIQDPNGVGIELNFGKKA